MTLLEVPVAFYCFPGVMQRSGERVQGGLVFLPEKAYSIKDYPFESPDGKAEEEKENFMDIRMKLRDIKTLLGEGSCDIRPMMRGKTTFIASREYPILHDVLANVARRYGGLKAWSSPVDDYVAVEYLSHNSLKDALYDHSLLPEVLENIIFALLQAFCHLFLY